MALDLEFQDPILSSTSFTGGEVVAGDFNGDGFADVAFAQYSGVSIVLGDGTGTFGSAIFTSTGGSVRDLAIGDFNGDGKDDLAVARTEYSYYGPTGVASVLLGNGDGTFSVTDTLTGNYAVSLAVGDFDKDGAKDDFALLDSPYSSQKLSLLINGSVSTTVGTTIRRYLTSGDFNGDGFADLVGLAGSYSSPEISVLINNQSGGFEAEMSYSVSTPYINEIAVEDLNGDGFDDVVTSNGNYPGTVSVLLADGSGTGTLKDAKEYSVSSSNPTDVAIADFNGDGKLDIVTANRSYSNKNISILLGNGNGTFADAVNFAVGGIPVQLAVGDFNGDELIDVAARVFGAFPDDFSVLLNSSKNLILGTAGNDRLNGTGAGDSIKGLLGNDRLFGNGGDDKILGGAGNDNLDGGAGSDRLFGGNDRDTITGGDGDDKLFGENGDDTLNGGSGDDLLDGGVGNDKYTGGLGKDTFVIGSGQASDTIADFQDGLDKIQLTGGLTFGSIVIQQKANNTIIFDDNTVYATLSGVKANTITNADFV